jgi:hypothetical protein
VKIFFDERWFLLDPQKTRALSGHEADRQNQLKKQRGDNGFPVHRNVPLFVALPVSKIGMGSHSVRSRHKIDVDGFVAIASQCSVLKFKFGHLDDGVAFPSSGLAFRVGPDLVREVEKVSSSVNADDNIRMTAYTLQASRYLNLL